MNIQVLLPPSPVRMYGNASNHTHPHLKFIIRKKKSKSSETNSEKLIEQINFLFCLEQEQMHANAYTCRSTHKTMMRTRTNDDYDGNAEKRPNEQKRFNEQTNE